MSEVKYMPFCQCVDIRQGGAHPNNLDAILQNKLDLCEEEL
jgi:hypothetical protein